jgi:anti-sigma B factor antagonist
MEKNPLHEVLVQTCTDKVFRERFVKDPAGVLRKASIQVPDGITIKVLQNTDDQIYIVLPTSLEDQPAGWTHQERPAPGEMCESASLTIRWTETGVSLGGRINSETAPKLRQELERATVSLLIDFAEVTFMSSAGLGVLLAAQKRLAANQKELYLCNVAAPIKNIFSLSALDSYFKFVNSDLDSTWWMAFPMV